MAVWSIVKLSELEGAKRLDAEYYQAKYRIDFGKGSWVAVGDLVDMCQYGISQAMMQEPVGCPIFRMDDIRDGFLVDDEVKYVQIPQEVLIKYKLERDDILFNRVNSEEFVGRTGIFKLGGDYVFASYLIRLRVKSSGPVLPDYLNVFLNCALGVKQIRKLARRAVNQANVNGEELRGIRVAVLALPAQEEVKGLCEESFSQFERCKSLYLEAQRMVLQEIGWDELDLSQPRWWTGSLSQAREIHRLDAEHFQPRYDKVIAHLKKRGKVRPLGEMAGFLKRGLQPRYVEDGEIIVVNSQHLGRYLLNVEATERTDRKFWEENKVARIERGDLLIYATGAPYVGRTNWYLENGKAIASNHVTILRTAGSMASQGYLQVFLNSPVGMMQAACYQKGSNQQELYPEDIARLLIYLPSQRFQQQVADLVQQCYKARQKGKALLDEAKVKVEALIESGAPAND